jgi:hypothetical protein
MNKNIKMKQRAKLVLGVLAILVSLVIGWFASSNHGAALLSLAAVAAFSAVSLDLTWLVWMCPPLWLLELDRDLSPFLNLFVVLALVIVLIVFEHVALAYACVFASAGALLVKEVWDWVYAQPE